MPVPDDGTRRNAEPKRRLKPPKMPQEAPIPDKTASEPKNRRAKRRKGKEVEEPDDQEEPFQVAEDSPWAWKSLTDSSASKVPPVPTKDGRYFFSVVGPSVKIYSVKTGQVVSTLDASEHSVRDAAGSSTHTNVTTTAVLNPHNSYQLITGSLDGHIRVWDFLDAVLLQDIDIARPIFHIAAHEKIEDYIFVAVAHGGKKRTKRAKTMTAEDHAAVMRISLRSTSTTAGSPTQVSSSILMVGKTRATTGLAISPSGTWLVATGGHKAYVCATAELKAGFTKFVSPHALTCLAFHPSEEYFATGDAIGRIRLWYCLDANLSKNNGMERKAQTTTLHWHAHAVSSITFTANGAYLLSGGEEAVLVIWQLHSGNKEYVPRVGAPIVHVALSKREDGEEEYLLGLADASFVFVRSGTLRISRSIARIKLDPAISHSRPSTSNIVPLAVHSPSSTLLLPSSHPSSLQVFSPSASKLLLELEVSPSNRVSRRDETPLEPSCVEHAIINATGEWMVTVDRREADENFHGDIHMKMWSWDSRSRYWTLNTRIDRPHGLRRVTGVAFRPVKRADTLLLVTTGEDGNVKTWRIQSMKQKSGETEDFWVTRSTFRFRSEIPAHASWSADGSLFAVSMGPHVAIYDGQTNALHQVLTSPECKHVSSARFIGPSGRYVAVMSSRDVMLWDLVSRSMRWHYHASSSLDRLLVHPTEELFAVFECPALPDTDPPSTRVLMFRCPSANPTASRTVPFRFHSVVPYTSLEHLAANSSSFTFVGITQTWSVVIFGDIDRMPQEEGSTAQEISGTAEPGKATLFQDLFGKSAFADLMTRPLKSSSTVNLAQSWKGKEAAEIFDAPSYLMPPLRSLFDSLLDGFLTRRPLDDAAGNQEQEHQYEDVDMEDDETPLTVETRIERVVDKQEMETFIDLFKQHSIKASSTTQRPKPSNGVQKINGVHKPRANGIPHPPSTLVPLVDVNGVTENHPSTPTAHEIPADSSSPVALTGKKRKKSLG